MKAEIDTIIEERYSDYNYKSTLINTVCLISHSAMYEPTTLNCGHTYELNNIRSWHESGQNGARECPTCRRPFGPPFKIDDFKKEALEKLRADIKNDIETQIYQNVNLNNPFYSGIDYYGKEFPIDNSDVLPYQSAIYIDSDLGSDNAIIFMVCASNENINIRYECLYNAFNLARAYKKNLIIPSLCTQDFKKSLSAHENIFGQGTAHELLIAEQIIENAIQINLTLDSPISVLAFIDDENRSYEKTWNIFKSYSDFTNLPFKVDIRPNDGNTNYANDYAVCLPLDKNINFNTIETTKNWLSETSFNINKLKDKWSDLVTQNNKLNVLRPIGYKIPKYNMDFRDWLSKEKNNAPIEINKYISAHDITGKSLSQQKIPKGSAFCWSVEDTDLATNYNIAKVISAAPADNKGTGNISKEDIQNSCRNIARLIMANNIQHFACPLICGKYFYERFVASCDLTVSYSLNLKKIPYEQYIAEIIIRTILDELEKLRVLSQHLYFVDYEDKNPHFKNAWEEVKKRYNGRYIPYSVEIITGNILETNKSGDKNFAIGCAGNTELYLGGNNLSVASYILKGAGKDHQKKLQTNIIQAWKEYCNGNINNKTFSCVDCDNKLLAPYAPYGAAIDMLSTYEIDSIVGIVVDKNHYAKTIVDNFDVLENSIRNVIKLAAIKKRTDVVFPFLTHDDFFNNNNNINQTELIKVAEFIINTAINENAKLTHPLNLYFVDYTTSDQGNGYNCQAPVFNIRRTEFQQAVRKKWWGPANVNVVQGKPTEIASKIGVSGSVSLVTLIDAELEISYRSMKEKINSHDLHNATAHIRKVLTKFYAEDQHLSSTQSMPSQNMPTGNTPPQSRAGKLFSFFGYILTKCYDFLCYLKNIVMPNTNTHSQQQQDANIEEPYCNLWNYLPPLCFRRNSTQNVSLNNTTPHVNSLNTQNSSARASASNNSP